MSVDREDAAKAKRERELEARAWRELCPKCGARPGDGCVTEAGVRTGIHRDRKRMAAFIPIVGGRP